MLILKKMSSRQMIWRKQHLSNVPSVETLSYSLQTIVPFVEFLSKNTLMLKYFHHGVNSYQLLAIIGGLFALIPSLVAIYTIERILFSLESYTGRDLSGFTNLFIAAGIATSVLCIFVIAISFLIKKPKKVGKILFFVSFAILIISLGVGVVGFALILLAGIVALQRRHY